MVKRSVTEVIDALRLTGNAKEHLRVATLDFIDQKYKSNAAKISNLSPQTLNEDAKRFLDRHGRRHFPPNREHKLMWPRDDRELIQHISDLMQVQAGFKRKRVKETGTSNFDNAVESNSDDGERDNRNDSDEEYTHFDAGHGSPRLKLHNTRRNPRNRPMRKVAIVPSVEPSLDKTSTPQNAIDIDQVPPRRGPDRRASFDRVIIPRRDHLVDTDQEALTARTHDTITVQDSRRGSCVDNDSIASLRMDDPTEVQSHYCEQLNLSYCQPSPPMSQIFVPDYPAKPSVDAHDRDVKPHLPLSETHVIDMTNDVEIYLDNDRMRSLNKEQVTKIFQNVLYWLYDRSDKSELGKRMIREAQPHERAEREHEARYMTQSLRELWGHPLWNESRD